MRMIVTYLGRSYRVSSEMELAALLVALTTADRLTA